MWDGETRRHTIQALGFGHCVVIKNACCLIKTTPWILPSFYIFPLDVPYCYPWHPYSKNLCLLAKEFIILYFSTSLLDGGGKEMPSWSVPVETLAHVSPGCSKAFFLESNHEGCSVIYVICLAIACSMSKAETSNKCVYSKQFWKGGLCWSKLLMICGFRWPLINISLFCISHNHLVI